jgi:hypothetical protein
MRLPHILDNRLTDGGEISLTRLQLFNPIKIPGSHFCQSLSKDILLLIKISIVLPRDRVAFLVDYWEAAVCCFVIFGSS